MNDLFSTKALERKTEQDIARKETLISQLGFINRKVSSLLLSIQDGGKDSDLKPLVELYAKLSFGGKDLEGGAYWNSGLDDWLFGVNDVLGTLGKAEFVRVKLDRRAKETLMSSVNAIQDEDLQTEVSEALGLVVSVAEEEVIRAAYAWAANDYFDDAIEAIKTVPNPNGNSGHYTRLSRKLLEVSLKHEGAKGLERIFAGLVGAAKGTDIESNLHLAMATLRKKNYEACVLFNQLIYGNGDKSYKVKAQIALDKLSLKKSTFTARMKQYRGNLENFVELFEANLSEMKQDKLTLENCFVWAFGHLQGDGQGKAIWLHLKEIAKGLQGSNLTTKISKYRKAAPQDMQYWISGSAAYLNAANFEMAKVMLSSKRKGSTALEAKQEVKAQPTNSLFGAAMSEDEQNKALLNVWTSKGQMEQAKNVLEMERKAEAKALNRLIAKLEADFNRWEESATLVGAGNKGILQSHFEQSSRAGLEACHAFGLSQDVACYFFVMAKWEELQQLESFRNSWGIIDGNFDYLVEDLREGYKGKKNLFKVRPYRLTVVERKDDSSPKKVVNKTVFALNMEQAVLAFAQDVVSQFYKNQK